MFPSFLPSDDRLAEILGIATTWEIASPYVTSAGHWLWYVVGGFFLVVELVLPGISLSWIGTAALCTGIFVKLGLVYDWGHFTFGEQICIFLLFGVMAVSLWFRFGRVNVRNALTNLDRRV